MYLHGLKHILFIEYKFYMKSVNKYDILVNRHAHEFRGAIYSQVHKNEMGSYMDRRMGKTGKSVIKHA